MNSTTDKEKSDKANKIVTYQKVVEKINKEVRVE